MSGTKRSISEMEKYSRGEPKLVMFTADALIDGRKALKNVIAKLFATLKPLSLTTPTQAQIFKIFAKNPQPLSDIFTQLGLAFHSQGELDTWTAKYCEFYKQEVMTLYPESNGFLEQLRVRGIPVVVLTAHPDILLKLIEQSHLQYHVGIVVDQLTRFMADLEEWRSIYATELYQRVAQHYASLPAGAVQMSLSDAMIITNTPKLLNIGRAIEAQTCWVKLIEERVEGVEADIVVGGLAELGRYIFGPDEKVNGNSSLVEVYGNSGLGLTQVNGNPGLGTTNGANGVNGNSGLGFTSEVNGIQNLEFTHEVNEYPGLGYTNGVNGNSGLGITMQATGTPSLVITNNSVPNITDEFIISDSDSPEATEAEVNDTPEIQHVTETVNVTPDAEVLEVTEE